MVIVVAKALFLPVICHEIPRLHIHNHRKLRAEHGLLGQSLCATPLK